MFFKKHMLVGYRPAKKGLFDLPKGLNNKVSQAFVLCEGLYISTSHWFSKWFLFFVVLTRVFVSHGKDCLLGRMEWGMHRSMMDRNTYLHRKQLRSMSLVTKICPRSMPVPIHTTCIVTKCVLWQLWIKNLLSLPWLCNTTVDVVHKWALDYLVCNRHSLHWNT